MKQVFDEVAYRFARSIDGTIESGYYPRGELFLELARRNLQPGGYILDYGCGPGRLSLLLANQGYSVLGVDTSPGMIAEAHSLDHRSLPLKFAAIDAAEDVLSAATYDGIVCSSVIEYVADADGLLQGFRRALRDSGTLIISFANSASFFRWYWNRNAPPNPMGAAQHHVWTWSEFRSLLSRNGFAALTKPRFFDWPLGAGPMGKLFAPVPFLGSLGVVVARPQRTDP